MSNTIYLVEDDENLNLMLKTYLVREGWKVLSFLNGEEALNFIEKKPDLWILDIMLPNISGYELIKKIKEVDSNTPVIFISARDQDIDRVIGLELGSDDYLSKPFLPRELILRVKNIFNRSTGTSNKNSASIGPYEIFFNERLVKVNNSILDLTTKEYELLIYFYNNQNMALSREQILDEIWGNNYFGSTRVVDDLIRRIRKKLDKLDLETIYGYGYKVINNER